MLQTFTVILLQTGMFVVENSLIFPFEIHRSKNQQLNITFVIVTRLFLLSFVYSSFRIFSSDRLKDSKKLSK